MSYLKWRHLHIRFYSCLPYNLPGKNPMNPRLHQKGISNPTWRFCVKKGKVLAIVVKWRDQSCSTQCVHLGAIINEKKRKGWIHEKSSKHLPNKTVLSDLREHGTPHGACIRFFFKRSFSILYKHRVSTVWYVSMPVMYVKQSQPDVVLVSRRRHWTLRTTRNAKLTSAGTLRV